VRSTCFTHAPMWRRCFRLENEIDLIIPVLAEFVRTSLSAAAYRARHGEGICHVYVDDRADLDKAFSIVFDSKVQYPPHAMR